MKLFRHIVFTLLLLIVFIGIVFNVLAAIPSIPEKVTYGVTFSKFRADELNLPWKDTYRALLEDLGVRHFRLVAHWQMIEPEQGSFNFDELDYQMRLAEEYGAEVVLAVGRRLPSWPECHEPSWIKDESLEEQKDDVRAYITAVVERYKDSPALKEWQVENEPFIIGFALGQCGALDIEFLEEEVALVRTLDPAHPVLLTASGELGFWNNTWVRGDVFGTTLYREVWNRDLDAFVSYPTTPAFFRAKRAFTELTTLERKPAIIAELAAEPWVEKPIVDTPLEEQLYRMNIEKLHETITFAKRTSFERQYLWGAEWWYYLKEIQNYDAVWEWARPLFEEK
ncbi:MAG: beta-galactosidase [Patescibacteria group bacterium UBA2163]